ncbi:TlpA disulfide reductase family protein [Niallia taxi]|uniref:TlpA disulfide reductase family protein n=1 Tax=Niallia taxi TaxID=2499688 RepID=UPI00300A1BBF
MKKTALFLSILISFSIMFLDIPQTAANKLEANIGVNVGNIAPDFTLKNLQGKDVRLSSLRGKKVIINFWATWCPPCKQEIPEIEKFYQEYKGTVEVLAVNIDGGNSEAVALFTKKMNVSFPVLLDNPDGINEAYKVMTIPTTFFIDENGIITNKYFTVMSLNVIEKLIKSKD